jgi:DNA-binding LacI/PurR family transcriptional regulator
MRTTISDIARLTETSPTAVSFVLNGKDYKRVSPAKRQAILDAIEKYGYRRNMAAKGLTMKRAFRIGICVAGKLEQFKTFGAASQYGIINHAAARLHESGYGIALLQLDPALALPETCRRLAQEDVDGLLFVNFPSATLAHVLTAMAERGVPAVSVGTPLDAAHSWVAIDRENSFELGCTHLLGAGLKRIVMLDIDTPRLFTEAKRRGYERAMRNAGLEPLPTFSAASTNARGAYDAACEVVARTPDVEGLLLTDNGYAAVVQLALGERRPRLLGFGDDDLAAQCDPKLSYLSLPVIAVADAAVEHLLQWIDAPDARQPLRKMLPCDLIVQET